MVDYNDQPYEDGEFDDGFVDFDAAAKNGLTLLERPLLSPEVIALRRMPYPDYLRSHHWRTIRARALLRAGGNCQKCEEPSAHLEVHHLTYIRRGCEAEADLIVLCDICHALEHRSGATP